MHQTGNIALVLALDRHNIAPVALGNQRFLQILGLRRRGHNAVERLAHARVLLTHLPADVCQLRRSRVRNLLLTENGARNAVLQKFIAGQAVEQAVERGRLLLLRGVALYLTRTAQECADAQQLARAQHAAHVRALERIRNIAHARKWRRAVCRHQALCVLSLLKR